MNRKQVKRTVWIAVLLTFTCWVYAEFVSPVIQISKLRSSGCHVDYGLKSGFNLIVPANVDLHDVITRHYKFLNSVKEHELVHWPVECLGVHITLGHDLIEEQDFEALKLLQGEDIFLLVHKGVLDDNQIHALKSKNNLRMRRDQ